MKFHLNPLVFPSDIRFEQTTFLALIDNVAQIHDGRSSSSFMIGRYCGNNLPRGGNIISTHNQLYLWFRSDNSTAHDGFELSWESIDPGKTSATTNLFY